MTLRGEEPGPEEKNIFDLSCFRDFKLHIFDFGRIGRPHSANQCFDCLKGRWRSTECYSMF